MVSYFVPYKTWLLRFLENEIYFKGRFGHKEGSETKIRGPKEQDLVGLGFFLLVYYWA
jgi:hypothetical protein